MEGPASAGLSFQCPPCGTWSSRNAAKRHYAGTVRRVVAQRNVIRLEGGFAYSTWRFIHGPGLDDPMVGLRNVNGVYEKFYYQTDTRGRQRAFTDAVREESSIHALDPPGLRR